MKRNLFLAAIILCCYIAKAQCPAGQVQVFIDIKTDAYGKEGYWEFVPTGNTCGTGTIFSGGNPGVGCNGGGQQNNLPGGYPSDTVMHEGPWCLNIGDTFDIIYTDDYGDGGMTFSINIGGYPVYSGLTGSGNAPGTRFTFVAKLPPASDVSCRQIKNGPYVIFGSEVLKGWVKNLGADTVHSVDLNYSIDNGAIQNCNVSGLNISPFDSALVFHTVQWNVSVIGDFQIKMWANNPNGNTDSVSANDSCAKTIAAGPGIPNIIDDYIGMSPVLTVIGNKANDSIDVPRDLDFHPILTRNELWVVLKSTSNIGGKTVKFTDAGRPTQTSLLQKDDNAWHFMALPTGIAFSNNENFSTSPGIYDANHGTGSPFTGPTLWSSDPAIYCHTPPGGNGSHIDMLHQSPYSMGICSEEENIFWVFDDNDHEIVRYDFVKDHGPGNSDHSDGIVRRFQGMNLKGDPAHHVPSHLVLKKETGMLYIVDTDNDRILKMDIHSGTFANNLTPYEPLAEYSTWTGVIWSVIADSGLVTPSGIDLIENRLIVSDYATGDIIIYDISSSTAVEMGRIVTGTPGIMGIKIGPDGKIWYVNAMTNQVIRLDGLFTGIDEHAADNFSVYPNPATSGLNVLLNGNALSDGKLTVYDSRGSVMLIQNISKGEREIRFDVSSFSSGVYTLSYADSKNVVVKRFVRE